MSTTIGPRLRALLKWTRVPVWMITHDRRPGAIVLMYHCVGGGTSLENDILPELLDRQLAYLRRRYRVVSLDELVAIARRDRLVPSDDVVVLTFDDGHEGVYSALFPMLRRYNIPVTVYVPTVYVEEGRPFNWGGYRRLPEGRRPRPMSWPQLRELAASGLVTIGAHTHSHRNLSRAAPETIYTELETSNHMLHERLGIRPRHFAYPYGVTSPAAAQLVAQYYDSAAIIGSRRNAYGAIDPHALRRVPVPWHEGLWFFRSKLAGLDAHSSAVDSKARETGVIGVRRG